MSTTRTFASIALALACCLTLAPFTARAGEVNLRPKFTKGAEARYELNGLAHNTTKAEMLPGGEMKQVVSQESRVAFKVVEANDKEATIEAVYERLKMEVKAPMPGMTPSFDSDSPADQDAGNTLAPVLRPIVGAKITLKVSANGTIVDVQAPASENTGGPFGALAAQFLDPEVIKSNFAMLFSMRNESGAAEVGGSWKVSDEQALMPGVNMVERFTMSLTAVDGAAASIAIEGTAELKVSGGQMEGAKTEESKIVGEAVWNTESGMLQSMDIKSFMRISAEPQEGMTMVLETDRVQGIRRVK